jgi:hypothetical protein
MSLNPNNLRAVRNIYCINPEQYIVVYQNRTLSKDVSISKVIVPRDKELSKGKNEFFFKYRKQNRFIG